MMCEATAFTLTMRTGWTSLKIIFKPITGLRKQVDINYTPETGESVCDQKKIHSCFHP